MGGGCAAPPRGGRRVRQVAGGVAVETAIGVDAVGASAEARGGAEAWADVGVRACARACR